MQSNQRLALTPTLSPKEREIVSTAFDKSPFPDGSNGAEGFTLSLSERERAGVRVGLDGMVTAKLAQSVAPLDLA